MADERRHSSIDGFERAVSTVASASFISKSAAPATRITKPIAENALQRQPGELRTVGCARPSYWFLRFGAASTSSLSSLSLSGWIQRLETARSACVCSSSITCSMGQLSSRDADALNLTGLGGTNRTGLGGLRDDIDAEGRSTVGGRASVGGDGDASTVDDGDASTVGDGDASVGGATTASATSRCHSLFRLHLACTQKLPKNATSHSHF